MDEIISDGEEPSPPRQPGPGPGLIRRRRARPSQAQGQVRQRAVGSLVLVLILCDPYGWWKNLSYQDWPENVDNCVVGVGLTRWELMPGVPQSMQWLADAENVRSNIRLRSGYVVYPAMEYASLVNPMKYQPGDSPRHIMQLLRQELASSWDKAISTFSGELTRLEEIIDAWTRDHNMIAAPRMQIIKLHRHFVSRLTHPTLFHIVAVGDRLSRKRLVSKRDTPTLSTLKTWFRKPASTSAGDAIRASRVVRAPRVRKVFENMHSVDLLLDWLDASMDIETAETFGALRQSSHECLERQIQSALLQSWASSGLQTCRSSEMRARGWML